MAPLMQKVKRFLLSRKTVISLICAVGISCLVGSTIPQITTKTPQFFEQWEAGSPRLYYVIDLLQLNQVYTSAWFLILIALVAFSLAYSVYYQSKTLIKSKGTAQREITERSFKDFLVIRGPARGTAGKQGAEVRVEELGREIKRVFKAGGYRPYLAIEESRYFLFGKNRAGRWGGVIFHTGLLICILAALYGLAFQKRGFVQLMPADTFQGKDEDWQSKSLGVFARDFDPGFQVYLNNFIPTYWENDQVKDLISSLTVTDAKGKTWEFSVSPGKPVVFKGTKIYQSIHYGYVLEFILKKEGKHEPVGANFFLDAPGKKDQPFKGKMDFPTTDYILNMKFHPDLRKPSFYATLPGVYLIVTEKGKQRFKGKVLFSQAALFGNDALKFTRIYYWTGLTFVENYGMFLVYCGFALSTLGAFLIFMLPYKQVYLKVTEEGNNVQISMGGRSNRYNALFSEEFKELAKGIEKELGKHGNNAVA